ncbi:MAG: porin, partial [Planctomycetota bacterium]
MVKRRLTGLVAGSLACGMAGSAIANDEVAQLREELASMRAELAQVKAQTGASWMDEAREAELRAMVEDVIADASTRTAFQDGGLSAGHDGKFFLEGGGFRMNVSGQIQVRGVLNTSDDRDGDEEVLDGIEVRRAKVTLDGNIVDPKIGYFVTFSSDDSDGNTFLEDVGISYKYDSGIVVTAGRFKLPFLREELISSKRQIAVDRGVSTEFFTLNRADLVQVEVPLSVISEEHGDKAKLFLAYSDGGDSFSTEALDDTVDYAFHLAVDAGGE